MRPLHVAQVNFLPPPVVWDHEEVLRQWPSLVDVADAVATTDTRVTVVQVGAQDAQFVRGRVNFRFIAVDGRATASDRGYAVARWLEATDVDVIHVHGLSFAEETSVVSRCLPSLPILLQDHADRVPAWWKRARWRRWYASVAGVTFTAAEQRQAFATSGLFGPLTQWFAIPESSSRFMPGSREQARAETGLHGDPCVLWVGHLQAGKDPLAVLEGVAQAVSQLPGLQLWCAYGQAPLMTEVQRRIHGDPRLAGRVHLLGKLPHERVETLMRAADIFVAGSHAESCGYALLEALACGTMPVVTDIPSFRALTGGTVGHLWARGQPDRLAQALIKAAKEPQPREQVRAHFDAVLSFGALGRLWAQAYAQLVEQRWRRVS